MPRQRRGAAPTPARSAPTRPTVAPQPTRPAASSPYGHQQSQPHSTAAYPSSHQQHNAPHPPPQVQSTPVQQSSGPGLFGQMASTAA